MAKKIFAFSLFVLVFSFTTVQAAEFIAPKDKQSGVNLDTSEIHKNLYVAGGSLNLNNTTLGDLVAAGGTVNVEGSVEQDLFAAGGTVSIRNNVGGDVRVGGGDVTINGQVGQDVLAAGGNLTLSDKASVGGDVAAAGGTVTINSPVRGSVKLAGTNVVINSRIEGNVDVRASQNLAFGPKAEVIGSVTYKGPAPAKVDAAAKVGNINYTQVQYQRANREAGKIFAAGFFIKLLAWIIAAWILLRFWRRPVIRIEESIRSRPWANLGIGLVTFIVAPIIIILLLLTFAGYYLALVAMVFYVMLILLSSLIGALVLGSLIVRRLTKSITTIPDWQVIIIGVVVWQLIGLIPVIGWLVTAILFLMVFGTLMRTTREYFMENRVQ